jgi:uncharacterized membrane protein YfcA
MEDVSLLTLGWLFALAIVSGTIDAIAGGGGLLSIPGLMAAGLDPISAMATSKLQGIFSSLSAVIHFRRKDKIRIREHLLPAFTAFIASLGGAASLTFINPDVLRNLIPFLLIGITLWILFSPKLGDIPKKARFSFLFCALTFIPAIGFYNGFFGPGTGTFYAMSLVAFLGLGLHEATVRAKLYNLMSNLSALIFFLFGGHISWTCGLVMVVGTFIGGNIGARLILRHGTGIIKPALVTMSLAMSTKLLWQQGIVQKLIGL